MKGREFIQSLPKSGSDVARDDAIVQAVRDGHHAPLVFKPVTVKHGLMTATVWVMHDALMLGEPGDYVRVSMNADTAQRVAWELGCFLPTTKICDSVWDAADVRIRPVTQAPPDYPYESMDQPSRMLDYHREVDRRIARHTALRGRLVANIGKHWVLSNKATQKRAANYGWYVDAGGSVSASGRRMIQTLGTAHNGRHSDYSQVLRLVKDELSAHGQSMPLGEALLDPELCPLVSSEGVLKSLYVPTAAKYRPPDDQSYDGPDDRTPDTVPAGAGDAPSLWAPDRLLYKGIAPGSDVRAWQRFLGVKADSLFGPVTEGATKQFQRAAGLVPDGIVGPLTIAAANAELRTANDIHYFDLKKVTFRQAKNYTWANRSPADIKWIVLHSMESPEKPTMAEAVANWFAGPDAPRASAHFNVDDDSIVQSVKVEHVAWHAPGANRHGIGIEHAGRARQSRADWFDDFSRRMLEEQSAPLCAYLCRRWDVPAEYVDREGLLAAKRGITTHNEVTQAFRRSTHWDPGPGFPMDWYIERVKSLL